MAESGDKVEFLEPGPDWESNIADAPVIRITYGDDTSELTWAGPVIEVENDFDPHRGRIKVTTLNCEVKPVNGVGSSWELPVTDILSGEHLTAGGVQWKLAHVGKLGDPQFRNKRWSYFPS